MNFFDKLKARNEQPNVQRNRKPHIPFRLNLLFFVIFGLFVSLIVRLGYLQIAEGAKFNKRAAESSKLVLKRSAPRGEIYDAAGNLLAGNEASQAITYTRGKNVTTEELVTIAYKVSELIDVPADELTTRDKKDFWLANPKNLKAIQESLTDNDKKDEKGNKITDESELYKIIVKKVPEDQIAFDEQTMKVATIFKRMNATGVLNTSYIKNEGVTKEEVAIIGEHIAEINGVSTGMDWKRIYPQKDVLRSIIGTVSSEKAGVPEEEKEEYLKKGYSLNDRVGTSYLEKYYEPILQGVKSESEVTLKEDGKVGVQKPLNKGKKGSNLKLTIDMKFQLEIEKIVKEQYEALLGTGDAPYSDGVYVVVMNPKNGNIIAMVAYDHNIETGELTLNPIATINKAFEPGSVVKGATISAGYENGVISGNDTIIDEPIKIHGLEYKASVFNQAAYGGPIPLTAKEALEYSSNVYMMKLVMKMMKVEYSYDMLLPYNVGDPTFFEVLRKTYGEYGMGVLTGIDLPGESPGIVNRAFGKKNGPMPGHVLDLSFGQYDTYTAMQLAQYASTVANGGQRIAPRLVSGIYENTEDGHLGKLEKEIKPEVLNNVAISPEQMSLIQQGFHDVVHGVHAFTTGKYMADAMLDISAKTGTAETSYKGKETVNSNVVAYAPASDPEIAVSVILPHLNSEKTHPNQNIVTAIVNAYAASKQAKLSEPTP